MAKGNNNKSNKKRRGKSKKSADSPEPPSVDPPRAVRQIQVRKNPVFPCTRALVRNFSLDSSTIDGFANTTIQITFSPGATDWRFDGTSIYQDSLPNLTEFTNLFDQWRIKDVVVRFDVPMGIANSFPSPIIYPDIYYIADYDDTGSATLTDIAQYPQMQIHNFNRDGYTPLMFKFTPKPLRDIAGAGISTSYGPMSSTPWIRTANFITPHYGIKLAFNWYSITQTTDIKMSATVWYNLEFCNPK